MSSNKLRLIHSPQTTPLTNELDGLVRQMIEAVDLEPRAYYRPPAVSNPDRKIESLERKVFEIEDWASRVEKWAIDEVRRAQEELAASTDTLAQCRLRIYELEMLVSDLDKKLHAAAESRSRQPVAKRESPPPIPKASRPARAEFDGPQWLSRASQLHQSRGFFPGGVDGPLTMRRDGGIELGRPTISCPHPARAPFE